MHSIENTKANVPLTALGLRLWVFLKQNKLSISQLLFKLSSTKKESKTGKKDVSIGYFAKFLKAKVDKKSDMNELREFAKAIDLDKDGCLCEADMETFLKRLNFREFFENESRSKS